jgi:hypothetical protein
VSKFFGIGHGNVASQVKRGCRAAARAFSTSTATPPPRGGRHPGASRRRERDPRGLPPLFFTGASVFSLMISDTYKHHWFENMREPSKCYRL